MECQAAVDVRDNGGGGDPWDLGRGGCKKSSAPDGGRNKLATTGSIYTRSCGVRFSGCRNSGVVETCAVDGPRAASFL